MVSITEISFESKCSCLLSPALRVGEAISHGPQASGFFWRHEGVPYLVTNRHCLTGKNARNELIGSFIPNVIQIHFWEMCERIDSDAQMHRFKAIEARLWEDGAPAWLEHELGNAVDVVALPLDQPHPLSVNCINDRKHYPDWKVEVGADCFIVGYPERLYGPEGTPIWKRASIASEPNLNYSDHPLFLCDSATRKGMSGGPVFGKALGFFDAKGQKIDPYGDKAQFFGHWPIFLGIYSGREGEDELGFQLGRVWKAEVLEAILQLQRPANSPFERSAMR